jgi:predicted RNase H-like HicB family nuclease
MRAAGGDKPVALAEGRCYTAGMDTAKLVVEVEREEDGRWIAEVPKLPGVMVYAETRDEDVARVEALALRVLADRLEHGEAVPELSSLFHAA